VLFPLYFNDLEANNEHGRPTSFADDTRILITGNRVNDVQRKRNETINKLRSSLRRTDQLLLKRK
jgi:hypothetical protein